MPDITVAVDQSDIQGIAEVTAAIEIGNESLKSSRLQFVWNGGLSLLYADSRHYLFLRDADDLTTFFGCGSARGGADTMVEDRRILYLHAIPRDECPNCKEESEDTSVDIGTKKVITEVGFRDIEALVQKVYNRTVDLVAEEEWDDGDEHLMDVKPSDITEYDERQLRRFLETGEGGHRITGILLNDLARSGRIAPGEYLITVRW